jgi:hypothetical protein
MLRPARKHKVNNRHKASSKASSKASKLRRINIHSKASRRNRVDLAVPCREGVAVVDAEVHMSPLASAVPVATKRVVRPAMVDVAGEAIEEAGAEAE